MLPDMSTILPVAASIIGPLISRIIDKIGETAAERAAATVSDLALEAKKKVKDGVEAFWKSQVDMPKQVASYLAEVQRQNDQMRILGMAQPVSLEGIFTDVRLLDKVSAWRHSSLEELMSRQDLRASEGLDHADGIDVVSRTPRLFVLGKPGAGKTTFLKWLVLSCTQMRDDRLNRVPIFVSLRELSDSGSDLMSFITHQFGICGFPDASLFVSGLLRAGGALVLFDGLDEVNLEDGARGRVIQEVKDFADQFRQSSCVITCRVAASDYQFEKFTYVEVSDFDDEHARLFVRKWFQNQEVKRNGFLREFDDASNKDLRELARTPLLLTLLCLNYEETMSFPTRRVELYEEAIDTLLKKWDSSRNIRRQSAYRFLTLGRKRQLLARMAADTFQDGLVFIPKARLVKIAMAFMAALPIEEIREEPDGEAVLKDLEAQHGLIVERAKGVYSFSHLTFHEYFTAKYIADDVFEYALGKLIFHAHDNRWAEVFQITASLLSESNAETFFDTFLGSLWVTISSDAKLTSLVSWCDKKSPVLLRRALYLWLECEMDRAFILDRTYDKQADLAHFMVVSKSSELAYHVGKGSTRDEMSADLIGRFFFSYHDSDFESERALDLARDIALDISRDFRFASNPTLASYTGWTGEFVRDWMLVLMIAGAFKLWVLSREGQIVGSDLIEKYSRIRQIALDRCVGDPAPPPGPGSASAEWTDGQWKQNFTSLQKWVQHRYDIAHVRDLSGGQAVILYNYLSATNRLLMCLRLAAVRDRAGIEARLLKAMGG